MELLPLFIFLLTIFLIFKQPSLRIPFTSRHFHIDYGVAPLIGAILLFILSSGNLSILYKGMAGTDTVRPYSILIIIFSLSYICVSLDHTGFFEYLSLKMVKASKGSGFRLFIYTFLLSSILTLFTDNDIVILTLTFLLIYVCRKAEIDPLPFLLVEFFSVNIVGMGLYIGNPTNIIGADAYGLSFLDYAKWMILPSFIGGSACFFILWAVFRKKISKKFSVPPIPPSAAIKNRESAIFGANVLCLTILFMSLPYEITLAPLWMIALFFALVMIIHDIMVYGPYFTEVSARVPWKICPFLFGLFVIVDQLSSAGIPERFGSFISGISPNVPVAMLFILLTSVVAAGFMNNHPMSLLFVKAIHGGAFALPKLGPTLALIAGSSLGGNLMLTGSLAGIMWARILAERGRPISFSEFLKYGVIITFPVIAVIWGVLIFELSMF
ncbi:MAG: ArsB/NhaD family transporter [Candidatus Hadarchaeales archaeon]